MNYSDIAQSANTNEQFDSLVATTLANAALPPKSALECIAAMLDALSLDTGIELASYSVCFSTKAANFSIPRVMVFELTESEAMFFSEYIAEHYATVLSTRSVLEQTSGLYRVSLQFKFPRFAKFVLAVSGLEVI